MGPLSPASIGLQAGESKSDQSGIVVTLLIWY
jgi:hypothetical protein